MSSTRSWRFIVLLAAFVVAFCIGTGAAHAAVDQVKVHMINVGSGDSALIEYNGHYALIDGGFSSHAGQYKDNKSGSETCALDKYNSLSTALGGSLSKSKLTKFYRQNLFSFYEHFDNDMKYLTGQNGAERIIEAAPEYFEAFDVAAEDYRVKTEAYDKEMKAYDKAMIPWNKYDEDLKEYKDKIKAWEDYEAAKEKYDQDMEKYNQDLEAWNAWKAWKEWNERHPDGHETPEDPKPQEAPEVPEPQKPEAPVEPSYAKPTNAPTKPEGSRPKKPTKEKTILSEEDGTFYTTNKKAFTNLRALLDGKYNNKPAILQAFMELQAKDGSVRKGSANPEKYKNNLLFKYYTALGYQFIYEQTDNYMKSEEYLNGKFNDCLTYLRKRGVKTLDYMVVSHSHKDHVGGLSGVLANDGITVQTIYYNGTSYGTGNYRVFEHEMLDRKAEGKTTVIVADDSKNNTFTLGEKVLFTELGDTDKIPAYTREPDQSSASDKDYMNHIVNNQSLVYRMDFNGESMLFVGDAEGKKDAQGYNRQAAILKKYPKQVNVDIYKASHHCHKNGKNASFNKAMSPYFVLTSCGKKSEPHKTARKALAGADMWITKGNGEAIIACIAANSFKVYTAANKDITDTPTYSRKLDYSVTSSYGTPNSTRAKFRAAGRKVKNIRLTTTKIKYYNYPAGKTVRLKVGHGWYYDKIQYQTSAGDKGFNPSKWQDGNTAAIQGNFRGTVYFRLYNKYGKSVIRKTDGYETRAVLENAKLGRKVMTGYDDVYLDWHPVKGAKKYKVWYKKGEKWKSKGVTTGIYKQVNSLPAGQKVTLKIQSIGVNKQLLVTVNTLKRMAKPAVTKNENKVRVSWVKVAGSTGYQVAVGSKIRTYNAKLSSADIAVAKKKKYNYRVRAFIKQNGKIVYAPWSKATKFKLK